jgi:Flp pilus assembly protein CpaB
MAGRVLFGAGVLLLFVAVFGSFLLLRPAEMPVTTVLPPPSTASERPQHVSSQLPAGQVAITVKLEPLRDVGGMIRPGDHVDLYGFFPPQREEGATTQLLLRDVSVHDLSSSAEGQAILLTMTPQRALLVQGALQVGARPLITMRSSRPFVEQGTTQLTDSDLVDWVHRLSIQRPESAG